jgi:HEAT repeat protein
MKSGMKAFTGIGVGLIFIALAPLAKADKKDDVARLIKELKAKDVKTRIAAAEELGHIGQVKKSLTEPSVPVLIDALHDSDAGVRKAAASALGKVDPDVKLAVPALTDALKDKASPVRQAAAGALGQIGPDAKDAVPALRETQKDSDRAVSRAANMAIQRIMGRGKKRIHGPEKYLFIALRLRVLHTRPRRVPAFALPL